MTASGDLVAQAAEAAASGDADQQRALLREAWEVAASPAERAEAAHAIAGIQPTAAGAHHWHRDALDHARQAPPEAVRALMPALLLAFAESLEGVGSLERATAAYAEAIEACTGLPEADVIMQAAREGLARTGG